MSETDKSNSSVVVTKTDYFILSLIFTLIFSICWFGIQIVLGYKIAMPMFFQIGISVFVFVLFFISCIGDEERLHTYFPDEEIENQDDIEWEWSK